MKLKFARAVEDPEKAVLPAIIYAQQHDDKHVVHMIAIGWWDFYAAVSWHRPQRTLHA